jgi:hypothetical protein
MKVPLAALEVSKKAVEAPEFLPLVSPLLVKVPLPALDVPKNHVEAACESEARRR